VGTIKDVARLAGVGVATASRVISGKGPFSADSASRVQAAIEQLDFRPSRIARALSMKSTNAIGVYVPDFKGPFYGPMLHAIDMELRALDRHMVIANGHGGEDVREQALNGIEFLMDRQCEGMLLTTYALRDADILALKRRFPNLAVVNRDVKGMRSQCFTVDHKTGGALAARTLLEHGHRRIAVIAGPSGAPDNRLRLQGFFDTLAEADIARESVPTMTGDFAAESGWAGTDQLLADKARFTAMFCCNDQMAMGAMSRLQAAGLTVPGDVSVMGYDDTDIAAWLSPRLTTIRIVVGDMGLNACRLLSNMCFGTALPVSREFAPELILRDSLARPKKG
jgi:LacI family transcriptional regulator